MLCQNGYPVLTTNRTTGPLPRLRKWIIPGTGRHVFLRDGSVGLQLVHFALWWHENIERIDGGIWDEWGWAVRPARGQVSGYSNHAGGAAVDINATEHPRGVPTRKTLTAAQVDKIHAQLKVYDGCIRWGGDYQSVPDAMHAEINQPMADVERVARELSTSPLGRKVLAANPGAAEVIWDGKIPGVPAPEPAPERAPVGEQLAIDYSYAKGKVIPANVRAAGYRGAVRYLSGNAAKDITRAEAQALLKAGLWILLVWELRARRAGEGRAAGVADAKAAEKQADSLGYPAGAVIFYAVDYDATPAAVRAYVEGVKSVAKRPVGVYGGVKIIDAQLASHGWQTMAWSAGKVSPHAKMLQRITRSRAIKGLAATDWDENLIITGVPSWTSTVTAGVAAPRPVAATSSRAIRSLHFNSQRTDRGRAPMLQLRNTVRLADVIGLNEVESPWQRALLKTMTRYSMWPTVGVASHDPILWDKRRFKLLDKGSVPAVDGVAGYVNNKFVNWVELEDTVTGKRFSRVVYHGPPSIDHGGKASPSNVHNALARGGLQVLRDVIAARAKRGPVIWSGDLNVDAHADKGATGWFPRKLLGPVTKFDLPAGGTLGNRLADWTGHTGPVTAGKPRILALGPSDHRGVLTSYTL